MALMKRVFAGLVISSFFAGCGSSGGTSGSFPTITPPIKAATPAGFKNATMLPMDRGVHHLFTSLDISEFENNFFVSGPTVLFNITSNVDNRIQFFNTSTTKSGCLSATPVAYTITPAGQATPITMYAQCYTTISSGFTGDPGLIMIGKNNGATYVWDANGAGWVAAIATPDGSSYDIHAWYSVGIGNGVSGSGGGTCGGSWDDCSYAVAEVSTIAATGAFEMTAAGIGIGYCGVQFASDGTVTWAEGSVDGPSCTSTESLCVLSSDEQTPASGGVCASGTPFSWTTPIGRITGSGPQGAFGASGYPGLSQDNVTLNGTSTDSVHFGPTSPPSGVAQF